MKTKAAVSRKMGGPYSIEELELDAPKREEVLIKYAYTGYCHTDLSETLGILGGEETLPRVSGHECSGIVEDVGPGVTRVKKGDHVVVFGGAACGHCPACQRGKRNLCESVVKNREAGKLLDGTSRFRDQNGEVIQHGLFTSGFSEYSVIPETCAIPIRKDFPLEYACLMGCCVPTGRGAVTYAANVQPGDAVAIYGLGGVGLNALRAAVQRQANPVIAVDIEANKEQLAYEFGATHFICSASEDPVPRIQELTNGGVQYAFEVIGDPGAFIQAWWSICLGGRVIQVGITDKPMEIPLSMLIPLHQKAIIGTMFGDLPMEIHVPRLVDLAMKFDFKFDKLITNKFKLEQLSDVADKMLKRQILGRWVLQWD